MSQVQAAPASMAAPSGFDVDLSPCDVKVGEKYAVRVPGHEAVLALEFRKRLSNGVLRFTELGTDQEFNFPIPQWDDMRSDRRACRISDLRRGRSAEEIEDIDPLALLDPEEPNITLKESAQRRLAARRLEWARTLRFYVIRYDEAPPGRGRVGIREFIDDLYEVARVDRKLPLKPSPQQVLRAVDHCGVPGERPLSCFLARNGRHDRGKRWPEFTLELAITMNTDFWSIPTKRKCDVISAFYERFDKENDRRAEERKKFEESRAKEDDTEQTGDLVPIDLRELTRPSKETLRLWTNSGENYWSWREKYGEPSARRRFKAHGRAIEATEPLQYVMIDHTRIDTWAAVYDKNGTRVLVERPWLTLAIDVYSGMILGAVLTYEGPSVYAALRCLRQVVRKKSFLTEKYGYHKGATDGFGKPLTVIVDNSWEFTGISFQVCCEAVGIHVIWAPVKSPEFKTYAERAFGVLNALVWHRLDAGVPYKPQEMTARGLDSRPKAIQTLEWLDDCMWEAIVTVYHVEEHGERKLVPALRWRDGLLRADGRPTMDDVGELDKVLGRSATCILTTSGITCNGERFHDKVITSDLLDRLLRHAKKRGQRKGLSSGKVAVLVTWDPGDVSFIHVWDWVRRKNVRLPNWYPEFATGLSWKDAEEIRKFAHERNMAFHSDKEMHAARAAYDRSLRENHPHLQYGKARKNAAYLSKQQLVAGDHVVFTEEPVATIERPDVDVPQTIPASERTDDRRPEKGVRHGGEKATRKAAATRARNRAGKAKDQAAASARQSTDREAGSATPWEIGLTKAEALERLSQLEEDL
ncbi:putative transposase [Bradyrhizobium liaoningense]